MQAPSMRPSLAPQGLLATGLRGGSGTLALAARRGQQQSVLWPQPTTAVGAAEMRSSIVISQSSGKTET